MPSFEKPGHTVLRTDEGEVDFANLRDGRSRAEFAVVNGPASTRQRLDLTFSIAFQGTLLIARRAARSLAFSRAEIPGPCSIEDQFGSTLNCRRALVEVSVPGLTVGKYVEVAFLDYEEEPTEVEEGSAQQRVEARGSMSANYDRMIEQGMASEESKRDGLEQLEAYYDQYDRLKREHPGRWVMAIAGATLVADTLVELYAQAEAFPGRQFYLGQMPLARED